MATPDMGPPVQRRLIVAPLGGTPQVIDDTVTHIADDEPLPLVGPLTVSWSRWQAERAALTARGDVGVRLPNDVEPAEAAAALGPVDRVTVDFPNFKDGRGYTLARLLRERHGYTGELRAVGDVLRDQLNAMRRCGFDSFELKAGKDPEDGLKAFAEFDVFYQPAADEALPLWRRVRRG